MGALCAALGAPASEVAVPLALLSAVAPVLPSAPADEAAPAGVTGGAGGGGAAAAGDAGGEGGVRCEAALFAQVGMLKSWKRCWCVIDGGRLIVHRLGASGEAAAQQKWRDKPLAERTANPNPNPNPSSNPNPSLGQERTA